MADARLAVANNSAALHIADAVRTPLLVLFSGSDCESQWRPRQAPAVLLRRPTDCSPCYQFVCPYRFECLDIPPREAARQAAALIVRCRTEQHEMNAGQREINEEPSVCPG